MIKEDKGDGKISVCVVKQAETANLSPFGDLHLPCPADPHLYLDRSKCKIVKITTRRDKYEQNK